MSCTSPDRSINESVNDEGDGDCAVSNVDVHSPLHNGARRSTEDLLYISQQYMEQRQRHRSNVRIDRSFSSEELIQESRKDLQRRMQRRCITPIPSLPALPIEDVEENAQISIAAENPQDGVAIAVDAEGQVTSTRQVRFSPVTDYSDPPASTEGFQDEEKAEIRNEEETNDKPSSNRFSRRESSLTSCSSDDATNYFNMINKKPTVMYDNSDFIRRSKRRRWGIFFVILVVVAAISLAAIFNGETAAENDAPSFNTTIPNNTTNDNTTITETFETIDPSTAPSISYVSRFPSNFVVTHPTSSPTDFSATKSPSLAPTYFFFTLFPTESTTDSR